LSGRSEAEGLEADESIATCAALHSAFVTLFYASEHSWSYYGFVLLLGLSAIAGRARGRVGLAGAAAVVLLAALPLRTYPLEILGHWRASCRSPTTLGLWTSPGLAAEWSAVLDRTEGRRAALLSWSGAGELFYPDRFGRPT